MVVYKVHIGVFLFVLLIALPKYTLIAVGKGDLRIEDFICLIAFIWLMVGNRFRISQIETYVKIYFSFLLVQLLSALLSLDKNSITSVLYPFRLMELMVWYFIGMNVSLSITRKQIYKLLTCLGLFFSVWSFFELLGMTPKIGAFINSDRASATMSGPFEYAVVIAVLGFFIKSWIPKSITLFSLLLTQSRITIVSTAFLYMFSFKKKLSALVGSVLIGCLLIFSAFISDVGDRIKEVKLDTDLIQVMGMYYDMVEPAESSIDYFYKTHKGGDQYQMLDQTDPSLELRLMRWSVILKTNAQDLSSIFLGSGPSFFGVAIDSYYMRIYAETGVVGLVVFIVFLKSLITCHRENPELIKVILSIAISGLLIDIFASMKVMALFWFLMGFENKKNFFNAKDDFLNLQSVENEKVKIQLYKNHD